VLEKRVGSNSGSSLSMCHCDSASLHTPQHTKVSESTQNGVVASTASDVPSSYEHLLARRVLDIDNRTMQGGSNK
jgi:hypothetical protein